MTSISRYKMAGMGTDMGGRYITYKREKIYKLCQAICSMRVGISLTDHIPSNLLLRNCVPNSKR